MTRHIHNEWQWCCPKVHRECLKGWKAHGTRILVTSFKPKQKRIKMDIIQYFASTNVRDGEEKDDFYNRLSSSSRVCYRSRWSNVMAMGDLNVKMGSINTWYEECMGRPGLGEMNKNGERFAEFCASNSLVIGGSIFQLNRIHKATWVPTDNTTENRYTMNAY